MKKAYFLFLTTITVLFLSIAQANAIKLQYVNSPTNSCAGAKVDSIQYISGNNVSKFIGDGFTSKNPQIISNSETIVQVYRAASNLLSNCTSAGDWQRLSSYAPGGNQRVVALGTNCTFNKPTNKNQRTVQFVYKVGYYDVGSGPYTWNAEYYTSETALRNGTPTYKLLQNVDAVNYKLHANECLNVELRYCGDGIREPGNGETCDPQDPTQTGWGNGGCNTNTCQPINNPTCNNLSVTPASGQNPLNVTTSCQGYKVNTWEIDCGNGQKFTGNGNNGGNQTFSRTCNYTTANTFTPTCTINGSITSNSCQKTVTVTNPEPSIEVDKRDGNVFDLDGNVGNDTQRVYEGERAIFKIRVTNNGAESLRNIKLQDAVEQSCATKVGGVVNLQNKTFVNGNNSTVNITVGGNGNHSNSTLEVGEWLEYTCEKTNTQSNYTNTVTTIGEGVISGQTVNDSDPTQVVLQLVDPSISIIKRDANTADLDNNVGGNDSQTVRVGNEAVFYIMVTNDGSEPLEEIELSDPITPSCASQGEVNLANRYFTNKLGQRVNIDVFGQGTHNNDTLEVGESFSYTCRDTNVQAAYTNVVSVRGEGVISGEEDTDTDPTEVLVVNPAIRVIKSDANIDDIDGIQYNDEQTVLEGEQARFNIDVFNHGTEDLKLIDLDDARAPACASDDYVDLAGGNFVNELGATVVIFYYGAGVHTDNILSVGEGFHYYCTEPNTTENYTNIVEVSGVGETSGIPVGDEDDTEVLVEPRVYDLALRKRVVDDLLCQIIGHCAEDEVLFEIEVINQGNVVATVKEIVDYIPEGLTLQDTRWREVNGKAYYDPDIILNPGQSKYVTIKFSIDDDAPDTVINYAEIAEDDGDDCDSIPDDINENQNGETFVGGMINDLVGTGCNAGGDEDDHDYEELTIPKDEFYDLALEKIISASTPGPYNIGDEVKFQISVMNQGNIDSGEITVVDYIPSGFEFVPDPTSDTWQIVGDKAYTTINNIQPNTFRFLSITFKILDGAPDEIINYSEISSDSGDDCDSTPDDVNGNQDGETDLTGLVDNELGAQCLDNDDEDDHDIETIQVGAKYDLALRKTLSSSTPGPFDIGDQVIFDIEIFNQGDYIVNDITVVDYIPTGLTLVTGTGSGGWTQSGSMAIQSVTGLSLNPGASDTSEIVFIVNADATSTITNYAEIAEDDGDDCDSTPNDNNSDDGTPVNDDIGTACEPGGDEDDHDLEIITINVVDPVCTNLTATPNTGVSSLSSTVVCTGENVTTFKIDCGNGATFSGSGSNSGTETFTKTCNYTTVGSFTPKCYVDDTITNNSCEKTVTVTPTSSSSSSSSSGGTPAVCNSISKSGNSITCNGNDRTKYFRADCGNGTALQVKQAVFIPNTGRTEAVFDCDYTTSPQVSTAKCEVTKNNSAASKSWTGRKACELGTSPTICGDGVIQRPNGSGVEEQCERVINADGSLGDFPSNCTNTCKFTGGGSSSSSSSSSGTPVCTNPNGCNVITIPNHGDIVFGPVGTTIIGHGVNPLEENGEHPFVRNDSDYDLYFDELCVTRSDGTSLDGITTQCTLLNDILYPGEKVELNPYPLYTGNKNAVPVGSSYGSNVLTTTIKTDGQLYDWAYFAADLNVRVSKPSIATTGGGTSFVKDSSSIANINEVAVENKDDNKNFVGTSVSTGDLSSYTANVTDTASVTQIEDTTDIADSSVEKVEDATATITSVTSLTDSEVKSYNGLANVFILNGSNLVIDSIPAGLTGPRTYIVQDADLIINGNLDYTDNIAFVVKGGSIKIDESVTSLSGTYISIPNPTGGTIEGIGGNTNNILTIKGSLYGDLTNLIDKRTYISNDTTTGQINVGTIVSFGSQVFKKPAPLVGQFITEYLDSQKVAQ